jgi:purine-binding chemotaxis protein CheW
MHDNLQNVENHNTRDFLTIIIADQRFGIPVLQVQDVLRQQRITRIPLAAKEIAGSLNLRGRIVTAIDVRTRLNITTKKPEKPPMSVVVEHKGELYSLIIDQVGDVVTLDDSHIEKNPGTLDPTWRDVSMGIYQMENELLVIMEVSKLLDTMDV